MDLIQNGFSCAYDMEIFMNLFFEKNEDVIIVDNLLTGHKEALLSDKFYNCDIREKEALDKVFKENLTKNINYTLKAGRNIVSPKGSISFGSSFKSMIKFIKLSIS